MATTAEEMAMAVLRGDMIAARQLADFLCEQYKDLCVEIPPITKVTTVNSKRIRVVAYCNYETLGREDWERAMDSIDDWISGTTPVLILQKGERIELYELPDFIEAPQ